MALRMWIAIVCAPILGAIVYAWLTLSTLPQAVMSERPMPIGLIGSGAVAGLLFEVGVLVPLLLGLRRIRRLGAMSFLLLGCLAWFTLCLLLLLAVGRGINGASATAVAMLWPGVALVVAFWLLGGKKNGGA